MKITLLTEHKLFSGANFLYSGLTQFYDTSFCCTDITDFYSYGKNEWDKIIINNNLEIKKKIKECDLLIIAATSPLKWIQNQFNSLDILKDKNVKIVIGDSPYCINHKKLNKIFEKYNIEVFIMPDITDWCSIKYKPYYPPTQIIKNPTTYKSSPFIITHIPGQKLKTNRKGSNEIKNMLDKLSSKYNDVQVIIQGTTKWKELIRIKQNTTLYIDQLVKGNKMSNPSRFGSIEYEGGLGKNGIESMMLGIPTLTSGTGIGDGLPMEWINMKNFEDTVCKFIENRNLLEDYRIAQQKWVVENCEISVVAKYILGIT